MSVIGIGMDLVDIARVERLIEWKGDRALKRLFTFREVDYAGRRAQPARSYAARLAAKEAGFKALAGSELARKIGWRDLEVIVRSDGSPTLVLHGPARRRAADLGVTRIHLTLTHTNTTAGAMVVLECDDNGHVTPADIGPGPYPEGVGA
jgi:holo-[acyl-carrier protein] synthase